MKVRAPAGKSTTDLACARHARQAVLAEPGRLEMREVTPPHPGPGEVLLQIKCALTCGTDLKAYRRGHPMWRLPLHSATSLQVWWWRSDPKSRTFVRVTR